MPSGQASASGKPWNDVSSVLKISAWFNTGGTLATHRVGPEAVSQGAIVIGASMFGHHIPLVLPGGYLLGSLLLVNLIAAHISRFQFTRKKLGIHVAHGGIILLLVGQLVETGMVKELDDIGLAPGVRVVGIAGGDDVLGVQLVEHDVAFVRLQIRPHGGVQQRFR